MYLDQRALSRHEQRYCESKGNLRGGPVPGTVVWRTIRSYLYMYPPAGEPAAYQIHDAAHRTLTGVCRKGSLTQGDGSGTNSKS